MERPIVMFSAAVLYLAEGVGLIYWAQHFSGFAAVGMMVFGGLALAGGVVFGPAAVFKAIKGHFPFEKKEEA